MNSTAQINSEILDGLPKQFVASLKILFDILDEEHTGLIQLRDIETRWRDEGVRDLPVGVMEGLRKVVPPNGFLTFECFVSGLKMALFQGRDHQKRRLVTTGSVYVQKENRVPQQAQQGVQTSVTLKGPISGQQGHSQAYSVNKSDVSANHSARFQKVTENAGSMEGRLPVTAAVKPQLGNLGTGLPSGSGIGKGNSRQYYPPPSSSLASRNVPPPSVPERSINHNASQIRKSVVGTDLNPPQIPPRNLQNQKIVSDLKNWAIGNRSGGQDRNQMDPYSIYENISCLQSKTDNSVTQQPHGPGKATVRRHGSGRRHTLQNGVDHNMIKRMQQLEEEGVMLRHGLEMVGVARDWYLRQLSTIEEKQKMLGKVNHNDYSLEAHQERMNFQRARITEVNMQLRTLVDSSEKGFPLHMNLAMSTMRGTENVEDVSLKMIREQNRRLTQEVSEKLEKISKLEQEKASLIRELFESRSKLKSAYDDTTFM